MASSKDLEERFNRAVTTIQNLPADGIIQPSNLTKLIFYGLYKQALLGPCKEARPSVFNYVSRAKWEAWDRCRTMTKEQAMLAYIDEIRKIIETLPQTNEVLEFSRSMGFLPTIAISGSEPTATVKGIERSLNSINRKSCMNYLTETNPSSQSGSNHSSTTESSSSSSSRLLSDMDDDYYDDASELLIPPHNEIVPGDSNLQRSTVTTVVPVRQDNPGGRNNRSNASSIRYVSPNDHSKETQRAILAALTKLQRDIHNILERLNRLETVTCLLQQRELIKTAQTDSSSWWLPSANFRRSATAFILLWPFIAFVLIRLFFRAKIIIRGGDREHLGIPNAVFVEDVDSFMQQPENDSADTVIRRLDDLNSKYRFMEMNLLQKKKRLRSKLPDIQICLDMIEQLRNYREKDTNMDTNFLLAHNLYGKATIPPTDKVCLWLGANVMLEYPLEEADELLRGNQKAAQSTLQKVDEDLDFLRDQITTTEVNMARLHNWAVKQKQQQQNKK
ncbi:unnamed protein product [Adineta ricciae]|uniref:ACB domain-containing protein n=1 Tax=Adineta ricciae TaxID=249248 RepID=A0A814CPM1_ADIRI|nr:unnamed protein product [Adineta ricciae]